MNKELRRIVKGLLTADALDNINEIIAGENSPHIKLERIRTVACTALSNLDEVENSQTIPVVRNGALNPVHEGNVF